jgi:ADP-ribosylglycohydrolase
MVGAIVGLYAGIEKIPEQWIEKREPLPRWAIEDAENSG